LGKEIYSLTKIGEMRKIHPNVDWRKYFNKYSESLTQYYDVFGTPFLVQIIEKLKRATNQRKPRPIILIKFRGTDIVSVLDTSEFLEFLNMLLDMCIHIEKYELCIDIKQIIDKYEEKQNKVKIRMLMK
jgi:uncharacterized protein (DUF1330 family)